VALHQLLLSIASQLSRLGWSNFQAEPPQGDRSTGKAELRVAIGRFIAFDAGKILDSVGEASRSVE
jgi:hypothetical protein